MQKVEFGNTKQGEKSTLFILTNEKGMELQVSNYGATWVGLLVPDEEGNLVDVVLGFDDVKGYEEDTAFLGAVVGRNANRIGGASFTINEVEYKLSDNNHGNNLHSGPDLYSKRMWETMQEGEESITFALASPHMDQGFPGNARIEVTYTLTEDSVQIDYKGIADQDTIMNMTNHSYFNLDGHASGSICNHRVEIFASHFTKADALSIPTGEIAPVAGTPMDFLEEKEVGKDIDADDEAIRFGGGFDHNWVLDNDDCFALAARMKGACSGIEMEVLTDMPGMQFYTANNLGETIGKGGCLYKRRQAACFETQFFPDAIHHENFISPICKAEEAFQSRTVYRFV